MGSPNAYRFWGGSDFSHPAPGPPAQRISFAAHASLGTSGVRFLKAPLLFSKAVMREGRTVTVRPRLADRLAAKDKTLPRVLDGDSAHSRTPGALVHYCRATLQATIGPEHFSFRRCFSVSVTLRQPKVTAQLPTGGDVSTPCPCEAWRSLLHLVARQKQGRTGPLCWSFCQEQEPRRPYLRV